MYEDDEKDRKDRDDLVEAGKRLKRAKALESRSSGLGVKAKKQAWKTRRGKA